MDGSKLWEQITPFRGSDSGVSLVEVLVAMLVLAIVMTGVAYGLNQSMGLSRTSRDREAAANLVAQALDEARAIPEFDDVADAEWAETVNGVDFNVRRTVALQTDDDTPIPCSGGVAGFWRYKSVNVEVTWPNMVLPSPVTGDTLLVPPIGFFDPTLGNAAVQVLNAAAEPVYNARVQMDQLDGGGFETRYTDSEGCVFVEGLTAGEWEFTVSRSGYVDQEGNTEPQQVVGVAARSTTSLQFDLDESATIVADLPDGAASSVPITLANTHLQPLGTAVIDGSGDPRTIADLYPFEAGYQLWTGECSDADPEGVMPDGEPYYPDDPATTRGDAVTVTGGETSTTSVPMARVDITITSAQDGHTIRAYHDNDFVPGGGDEEQACADDPPTYTLGTASSSQRTAYLPWGMWEIRATWGQYSYCTLNQEPVKLVPSPPLGNGPTSNSVALSYQWC